MSGILRVRVDADGRVQSTDWIRPSTWTARGSRGSSTDGTSKQLVGAGLPAGLRARGGPSCRAVRVHVVDPSAYTPPYDHALAPRWRARARTSSWSPAASPTATSAPREGYAVDERFYRLRLRARRARARALRRQAGPARARHAALPRAPRARADVVALPVARPSSRSTSHLLPRAPPLVLTAHDVLPREPRPGQLARSGACTTRVDAVVVHSEHGARRLRRRARASTRASVHVIPHGAFDHLARLPEDAPLPPSWPRSRGRWSCSSACCAPTRASTCCSRRGAGSTAPSCGSSGMPRMTLEPLRAARAAERALRPALRLRRRDRRRCFRRADLVVLPYREIDQSGVLFTALAFGKPLLLSDVGGFPEVAGHGAAELVPPGDSAALRDRAAAACSPTRRAARGARRGRARRRGRRPTPGTRSPRRHARCSTRAARDNPRRDRAAIVFWVCAGLIVYAQAGYRRCCWPCSRALRRGSARPAGAGARCRACR